MADVRKRLSRGSLDVQTLQLQPITGMPCDVPVPRNVKCIIFLLCVSLLKTQNYTCLFVIFAIYKKICPKLLKSHLCTTDFYPFENYKISKLNTETRKCAISKEDRYKSLTYFLNPEKFHFKGLKKYYKP